MICQAAYVHNQTCVNSGSLIKSSYTLFNKSHDFGIFLFQLNPFGCPAQSWTVACIQEVLYDLEMLDTDFQVHPVKSEENIVAPI